MNLSLCLCLAVVELWVSVPTKSLSLELVEQHRNHHMKKEQGLVYRIFNRTLKRIKTLIPTDTDSKQYYIYIFVYQAISVYCIQNLC